MAALKYKYPASALPSEHLLCSHRSLPFGIPSSQQPGDRLPSPPHHHHHPMDLFPDGGFVRLQSRVKETYVHADNDWRRVTLRPNDGAVPSLNAVWRVEHWFSAAQGVTFVLLQNAAYGRYLSFSIDDAPLGSHGRGAAQTDRSEPTPNVLNHGAYPWMWTVGRLNAPDQGFVSLRYLNCYLRANGRHDSRNVDVTADAFPDAPRITTMMHWMVHQVAASPVPQPLPITLQQQEGRSSLFFWRRTRGHGMYPHPPRTIRHVRANDDGEFDQNHHNWPAFAYYETSLFNLRYLLGLLQDDWNEGDMSAFTLCMRPGSHGRLIPLVTDLPHSLESVCIVVLRTGSPAAEALLYPAPLPPLDAVAA